MAVFSADMAAGEIGITWRAKEHQKFLRRAQFLLGLGTGVAHFGNMESREITGRFLPSRVYSRWKWIVRLGLMLVPFLVILSGGVKLFLSPNIYRSTTLFGLDNGPPPEEIIELVKSRGLLGRVAERLELAERFNLDRETAVTVIREATEARIVPDTRLIEMHVSLINKVDARDIAEQIPSSLKDYLVEIIRKNNREKAEEIDKLILDAADLAEEKSSVVANMEKIHGENRAAAAVMTTLERARRASMLADAEVERLKNLRSAFLTENLETLPRLSIHTSPVIADKAHSPKVDQELGAIVLQALVFGLLSALLLPYLMELVFAPVDEESGLDIKAHRFDLTT
jgi:hypothetical protein